MDALLCTLLCGETWPRIIWTKYSDLTRPPPIQWLIGKQTHNGLISGFEGFEAIFRIAVLVSPQKPNYLLKWVTAPQSHVKVY